MKPKNAEEYTVYEVIGWRKWSGLPVLAISNRPADMRWFGHTPEKIYELSGEQAAELIPRIDKVARAYPYMDYYRVWPGPNSNTFVAYVLRQFPEMSVDLPVTAIGKDYIPETFIGPTPSGQGWQVSLWGLLGMMYSAVEGIQINVLGLSLGVDISPLRIRWPGID